MYAVPPSKSCWLSSYCLCHVFRIGIAPASCQLMWWLQDALDKIVPEGHHYRHLDEGLDDMPAHVKVGMLVNDHAAPKAPLGIPSPS
jgi:hypothetical protein